MEITWKEMKPLWNGAKVFALKIKTTELEIKGSLHESLNFKKEFIGYKFSCSALIIKDYSVAGEDDFKKEGFTLRKEKLEYAQKEAIKVLSKKLIDRAPFYQRVIDNKTIEVKLIGSYPNKEYYDILIPDRKRIIKGRIICENDKATFSLPWLSISRKITPASEKEMKEEIYEIIKDNLSKKISLAEEFKE